MTDLQLAMFIEQLNRNLISEIHRTDSALDSTNTGVLNGLKRMANELNYSVHSLRGDDQSIIRFQPFIIKE